jgi:hypothetical protein
MKDLERPLGRPMFRWEENIKGTLNNLSGRIWISFIRVLTETGGMLL